MNKSPRHNAFSLLEVLFAMMVLTLGMIFVACQFPIGLSFSRQVADDTYNLIHSRNAQIMTELQWKAEHAANNSFTGTFIDTGGSVQFLYQVNYRLDNNFQDYVVDAPLGGAFPMKPDKNTDYVKHVDGTITDEENNLFFVGDDDSGGEILPESIARIAAPAVTENDPAVRNFLKKEPYNYTDDDFQDGQITADDLAAALETVAKERKYSQATLYQHIGSSADDLLFRLYIFMFRQNIPNARYAMQDNSGTPNIAAAYTDQDRLYPVPWYIEFTRNASAYAIAQADGDEPGEEFNLMDSTNITAAEEEDILALLRAGSILIDAINGYVYEIESIEPDDKEKIYLTLKNPLQADLLAFWVFPPAIDADGTFADTQPVIKMTQQVISLN